MGGREGRGERGMRGVVRGKKGGNEGMKRRGRKRQEMDRKH